MAAFYCGLEDWLRLMLSDVTKQVLEALVRLNFGGDQPFEVTTKPLAEQAMEQQSNAGVRRRNRRAMGQRLSIPHGWRSIRWPLWVKAC